MSRIPLYVHQDGVARAHPHPTPRRVAVLLALSGGSVMAGIAAAMITLLSSDHSVYYGLALPLTVLAVCLTGAFVTYRGATDPARIVARHHRFLNEETSHDR